MPKIADQIRDIAEGIGNSSPAVVGTRALADLGTKMEQAGRDAKAWAEKQWKAYTTPRQKRGDIHLPRENTRRSPRRPRR